MISRKVSAFCQKWHWAVATMLVLSLSWPAQSQPQKAPKHKFHHQAKVLPRHHLSTAKKFQSKKRATTSRSKPRKIKNIALAQPLSWAQELGLHHGGDPLALRSSVALVIDQDSKEVLFQKNPHVVLPIASITKLMTALVVVEAGLPMDEILTVGEDDRDMEKGSSSRLRTGMQFNRETLLKLALMASENRAAFTLASNYPGGRGAFVAAMNRKAQMLNMSETHFADPTGLASRNVSSAADLVKLVDAAYTQPLIREFSTQPSYETYVSGRLLHFVNTNRLIRAEDKEWNIGLQKTGYISEAGRCLVMQVRVQDRPVVMVFLDSISAVSRFADATLVRHWLEKNKPFAGIGQL